MGFKEHKPNTWTYEKDGDSVEGKLVSIEDNKAFKGKKIYKLEQSGGVLILVFGTTVLDSNMIGIMPGDLIKIVYKGTQENKKSKTNPTKMFSVLKDDGQ